MSGAHPYAGLPAVLATKHAKEAAIGPALAAAIGLHLQVPAGLDTDLLGTFSGEIERPGPPRETALAKARLGIQAGGVPRGLASEGAFGPDPVAFFVPAGLELIAFVDDELGLDVVEQRLSRKTNFAQFLCARLDREAEDFLARVGFPSHALVVRANQGEIDEALCKGVADPKALESAIARAATASADGRARIETDMRAHLNPTRMAEIGVLAGRLGERLAVLCGECGAPGYGVTEARRGLPCGVCSTPTGWIACEIEGCSRCGRRSQRRRSDGLLAADPGQCPSCNP